MFSSIALRFRIKNSFVNPKSSHFCPLPTSTFDLFWWKINVYFSNTLFYSSFAIIHWSEKIKSKYFYFIAIRFIESAKAFASLIAVYRVYILFGKKFQRFENMEKKLQSLGYNLIYYLLWFVNHLWQFWLIKFCSVK
jgi:hypothetical protein